jgi:hypothetical protein
LAAKLPSLIFCDFMRMKFVLALMSFAALVLAFTFYFQQKIAQSPPPAAVTKAVLPPPAAKPGLATDPGSARQFVTQPAPLAAVKPPMTPEEKQAYIEAETSRLQDLSTEDDPASLTAILNDLSNPEKEVRLAAIEASMQFGSRDAIPALQAEVANATDTDEKIALLQAADFLALPTLADAGVQTPLTPDQLQEQRQRQAARKQYLLQKHAQDQNALSPPAQNSQPPQ